MSVFLGGYILYKGLGVYLSYQIIRGSYSIVCHAPRVFVLCFVTALCLKDMMREYVRNSEYHPDIEKLRDLLSKVTDEQELNILQQTKNVVGRTALHVAA